MSQKRASPGVPLPTLRQLLLIGTAVCAGWLIWSHRDGLVPGSPVTAGSEADQVAALEHLHAVESISPDDPDGLARLTAELTNSNPRMRRNALLALRRFGSDAHAGLKSIRDRLADTDARVRETAIDAYLHIGRDTNDVALVISPMLGDPEQQVRQSAARVLETIGPPAVDPVTKLLRGEIARGSVPGLQVLRRIGWDGSQVETGEVVRALARNSDVACRVEALLTLVKWGQPTPVEIRELLQVPPSADSHPSGVRWDPVPQEAALGAIIRMGPTAAENLPDVITLLSNERGSPRSLRDGLAALRSMKQAALPAAPRLFQIFSQIQRIRFDVGWTLLEIGAEPSEIARIVIPYLADPDSDVCFHAGRLCALASPEEARRQVATLIPRLNADTPPERYCALNAIWGLAPEAQEAVTPLLALLESSDLNTARLSAKALGDIGPSAAPALPALLALVAGNSPKLDLSVRSAVFQAVGKMGPAARSAIPTLLAELNDPRFLHSSNRRLVPGEPEQVPDLAVISALIEIGDSDPAVRFALRKLLSSEIGSVRLAAQAGLAQLTPDSPEVLGDLLKWLVDRREIAGDNYRARIAVILTIGSLGVGRKVAVGPLVAELGSNDLAIRKAAALALGKIGPAAKMALPDLRELLLDWKNSLYDPTAPPYVPRDEDPRSRIETARWANPIPPLPGQVDFRRFATLSVHQAVREAVAAIDPPAFP